MYLGQSRLGRWQAHPNRPRLKNKNKKNRKTTKKTAKGMGWDLGGVLLFQGPREVNLSWASPGREALELQSSINADASCHADRYHTTSVCSHLFQDIIREIHPLPRHLFSVKASLRLIRPFFKLTLIAYTAKPIHKYELPGDHQCITKRSSVKPLRISKTIL